MAIIVIEGSNYSGKSTIIDKIVSDNSDIIPAKSVPDWFREYIPFARTLPPKQQQMIYEIGHIASYMAAKGKEQNIIFDRFYFSTFIRLFYQNQKSEEDCIREIVSFPYKPDMTFALIISYEELLRRHQQRQDVVPIIPKLYHYENEIYLKLEKDLENFIVINNDTKESNCDKMILSKIRRKK